MSIWSDITKSLCEPKTRLSVSEWAAKRRVIPKGRSPEPGRWTNERVPYLVEPMDAFSDIKVETVVCMMSSQIGKTELLLNVIGYYADEEPSPQLMVQPNDHMMEAFSKERVVPTFRESPGLKGKLDEGNEDRTSSRKSSNTIRIKHYPGGYLAFASAGTASGLATRPIRIALFDEVDRYPETKEGDPVRLGIQRTQNFYNRKIGLVSSPHVSGTSKIEAWWLLSDQRQFWVPCSHCGVMQVFQWANVRWENDDPSTAVYVCPHCEGEIRERQRNEMLALGQWIPTNPEGRYRGYHLNALYSPWTTFTGLAEEWIAIHKTPTKEGLKEFINLKLGEPWFDTRSRDIEGILALLDDRPRGLVPKDTVGLVAGVDVQDNGFWFEIRAFAPGHLATSWSVREGFIPADWFGVSRKELAERPYQYHPAFDPLRQVLWEDSYTDSDGRQYPVTLAGIDSGGHRTTEVYDFCRVHRGVAVPIRGERTMYVGYRFSYIDTYPGTNKPIPGGVRLCRLNVTMYKDRLSSLLDVAPADPGAFLFHSEYPEAYAWHYTAEYKDDKGYWECKSGRENHLFDCSVYGLAMADLAGFRFRGQSNKKNEIRKEKKKPKENPYTQGENPFAR